MNSAYLPRWLREEVDPPRVGSGVYAVDTGRAPFLWVAANELPLDVALIPFLVARTGQPLIDYLTWLLDVRPELCKEIVEVVPMSPVDYEALESQIEAVSEEEHRRRLRVFTERLAQKLGLLDEARATGVRDGQSEGRTEGRTEATRRHLLSTLERRQLTIGDEDRARVNGAADPDLLDRWFERALTAESVAEVFRDDP